MQIVVLYFAFFDQKTAMLQLVQDGFFALPMFREKFALCTSN